MQNKNNKDSKAVSKQRSSVAAINNARISSFFSSYGIIVFTVLLVIAAAIIKGSTFFNWNNLFNILRSNATIGIIAFGMAFVIISGNIDLSVSSQLVAVSAVTLTFVDFVTPALGPVLSSAAAVIVGIGMSCALSGLVGVLVTKGRVPSFIVTLGMQYIYRSLCREFMSGGGFTTKSAAYQKISNTELFGVVPMPIVYFVLMFLLYFYISKYTKLGRHIYAVGSNEKATRLSGINTDTIRIISFVLLGFAVGVASITESSRMGSINSTSSGVGYELNAIAMAVVGGIAMEGGKGSIVGVLFGILTLGIINNMLNLIGVSPQIVDAIRGVIIVLAVLLQRKEKER
ncbi:MAG: ABC transporter permease [Christensenellaceae bacterium]|nr:ABC transporter permease [Christensenellaceae bacterium]